MSRVQISIGDKFTFDGAPRCSSLELSEVAGPVVTGHRKHSFIIMGTIMYNHFFCDQEATLPKVAPLTSIYLKTSKRSCM